MLQGETLYIFGIFVSYVLLHTFQWDVLNDQMVMSRVTREIERRICLMSTQEYNEPAHIHTWTSTSLHGCWYYLLAHRDPLFPQHNVTP